MSPGVQALFWLAALICFVLAALRLRVRVDLVALGLAFFTVPWFWSAWMA